MHKDRVGHLAAAEVQQGRPEQGVKGDDVLADEVVLLGGRIRHESAIVHADLAQIVFQRSEVADRRIEPDIEVLARRIRNLDAKVGRVAADVPVAQVAFAGLVGQQPLLDLVVDLALQVRLAAWVAALRPFLQVLGAARIRQFEEVVLRVAQHGRDAGQRRIRIFQIGRAVNGAAFLAVVPVLVLGAAFRAFALDETVRQEHVLFGIEELRDDACGNQAGGLEVEVDRLRQLVVFHAVGGMPVVKADVKTIQIGLAARRNIGHKLLRCLARFFGSNHDRRAMAVVCADKVHCIAHHALVAHPDVGLDVLHDVTDVEVAVGVGQGGGDKELAWHGVVGFREGSMILVAAV